MNITQDKFVTLHYTLKDTEGNIVDSSAGLEPLGYIHGHGYLIAGLERELEGKTAGDKFNTTIQPADGYGERDERLVAEIPMDRFESPQGVEVGMQFQVMTPAGPTVVTVIEVNGDTVKIDGNHQMAGKVLNFEIEILEVRDATEEELASITSGCGGCGGGCGNCGGDCGGCGDGEGEGCGGGCGNCGN